MKRAMVAAALMVVVGMCGMARGAGEGAGDYLDGLDLLEGGKYGEAVKAFGKAIEKEGGKAEYFQARGVAKTLAGDFDGAIQDLAEAKKLATAKDWETEGWFATANKMNGHPEVTFAPGSAPRAEVAYAVALSKMGQDYWQKKSTDGFGKVAGMYVAKHRVGVASGGGETGKVLVAKIREKMKAGDYAGALSRIEAGLAGSPEDVDLLMLKGQAELGVGDLAGARESYTEALTRKQSAEAYLGRACAAASMGDGKRAFADMKKAEALDAELAQPAKGKIDAMVATNQFSGDPATLWRKLEGQASGGEDSPALLKTAMELVKTEGAVRIRYDEKYQDKLADLEWAVANKPGEVEWEIKLGRFLHDESGVVGEKVGPRAETVKYRVQSDADLKAELERSEMLTEKALREHPHDVAALTLKANLLIAAAKYDDAEPLVKEALEVKGEDPDLLEMLAGLIQIQAARRIYAAGNLKTPTHLFRTNFDQSPPVTWEYTFYPTKEELQQAAVLEQEANALSKFAEGKLEIAAKHAGATAMGFYYQATLYRARGDTKMAKESLLKALKLEPNFERAWYQLAAICTEMLDADGAVAARGKAYSLAQTTAAAELNRVWFEAAHGQLKEARATIAEGVKLDPADGRLAAYLGVVDEGEGKSAEALGHYRMAEAIYDAGFAWHGVKFGEKGMAVPGAEETGEMAAVKLRIGVLLLEMGKAKEAAGEFGSVAAGLAMLPDVDGKGELAGAMLPVVNLEAGKVPLAESVGTLKIRAEAGESYARWAMGGAEGDAAEAGKMYRRMFVSTLMTTGDLRSVKAIGDLGLTELHLKRGERKEAGESFVGTEAVPQDFWQERRRVEGEVRGK